MIDRLYNMVIDFHTHFYPEKIVERALATAREKANLEPALDGTQAGLLESMRRSNVDYSVALPLVTQIGKGPGVIAWAKSCDVRPLIMLGSVHPRDPEFAETLQLVKAAGFPGVKVHPEYQAFSFDEPELDKVWSMISDLGLFLITHAGQDSAFEEPFKSNPASLRRLHERHPALKLVIAHAGSWKMWEDVPQYLTGLKNVWFDLAFVGECMKKSAYRRLVDTLKVDNLLFGTDSPWCDQAHALELLHDLQLGSDAEAAICSGNALNLIKL